MNEQDIFTPPTVHKTQHPDKRQGLLKSASLEDALQELHEAAEEKKHGATLLFNIREHGINDKELSPQQKKLLSHIRTFTQDISVEYRKRMRLLMEINRSIAPSFRLPTQEKMMRKGYDLPQFDIYSPQEAEQFLKTLNEENFSYIDISPGNFLTVFNLPPPVGRLWYRGGRGPLAEPIPQDAIQWGAFYRNTMPVVHTYTDNASQAYNLSLKRINSYGIHDPKKYYYMWETGSFDPQADIEFYLEDLTSGGPLESDFPIKLQAALSKK